MPISRETREYRKTHGLCPRDGAPNAPNRKMCKHCLKKFSEKTKRHRQKKIDNSLCLSCGQKVDGIRFCDSCKKSVALSTRKSCAKRYRSRKQLGVCVSCSGPVVADKTMCDDCSQHRNSQKKRRSDSFLTSKLCSVCGKIPPEGEGKRCKACIDKRNSWYQGSGTQAKDKVRRDENRRAAFEHYGERCSCCGENEPCFLAIDHIEGDGTTHRKEINKWGSGFHKWLVDSGFPEGFQILCHNCNMGKHLNGGVCPHKTRKSTIQDWIVNK